MIDWMNITYSSHAVERMTERGISTKEIEQVLKKPDGKIVQSKDKYIFYKQLKRRNDNLIAVVSVGKNDFEYLIVTVLVNFEVRI